VKPLPQPPPLCEEPVVRTALRLEPTGRRSRGRAKKRWLDRINEDLRIVTYNQTMPWIEQHGEEPSMRTLQPSEIDARTKTDNSARITVCVDTFSMPAYGPYFTGPHVRGVKYS